METKREKIKREIRRIYKMTDKKMKWSHFLDDWSKQLGYKNWNVMSSTLKEEE